MAGDELAQRIFTACHLEGRFVLRSGVAADTYFDKYRFETDPNLLRSIAARMRELIPPETDLLAGLELGGIPLVTALSRESGMPALFVRKQAKTYGTCNLVEGGPFSGRHLVLVEDVATSGGQIIESAHAVRARGARIQTALCVIDRQAGAQETLAAEGIRLRALYTMSELQAAGVSGGRTDG